MKESHSTFLSSFYSTSNWFPNQEYSNLNYSIFNLLNFLDNQLYLNNGLKLSISNQSSNNFLSSLDLSTLSSTSSTTNSTTTTSPITQIQINNLLSANLSYAFSSLPIPSNTTNNNNNHIQSFKINNLPQTPHLRLLPNSNTTVKGISNLHFIIINNILI